MSRNRNRNQFQYARKEVRQERSFNRDLRRFVAVAQDNGLSPLETKRFIERQLGSASRHG